MPMNSELDEALDALQASIRVGVKLYGNVRRRLEQDCRDNVWQNDCTPEDLRDINGRPILLDAAVQLASARAAYATALIAREQIR